ncbi:MAG: GDYXXLXY domain-containing protein [Kiritimatiellia bacterium]
MVDRKRFWFTALLLAFQVAALGALMVRYERVVRHGEVVRLPARAYDPTCPVRGRYLRVTVEQKLEVPPFREGEGPGAFVHLVATGSNGLFRVAKVCTEPGKEGMWYRPGKISSHSSLGWNAKGTNESYAAFYDRQRQAPQILSVQFPGEFFLNERLADRLEKESLDKQSLVAVYRFLGGRMVLTDIERDGKSILEEAR